MRILESEACAGTGSIGGRAGKAGGRDIRSGKEEGPNKAGGSWKGAGSGADGILTGMEIGAKPELDLESLMNAYANMLLRMALVMLKDMKLAEDAVQETFLGFYASFASYRGEASVKTYLCKILLNECRKKLRMAWFKRNILTAEMDTVSGFGTDLFELADDRISLTAALMKLDAGSREVLLLYYYNDLSVTEISSMMNKPEGTIKSRLKRGRDRLRTILQEDLGDE